MTLLVASGSFVQAASPLSPSPIEWVVILCGVLHLCMFLLLMVWLPQQKSIDPILRFVGLLVALFIPVIGPILIWRLVRRKNIDGRYL